MPTEVIDTDDLSTWPVALLDIARRYPFESVEATEAMTRESIVGLLEGRPLRAYHASRLLPHEVVRIKAEGLRALTPELAERRIAEAVEVGAIDPGAVETVRRESVVGTEQMREGRLGQVCFVLGLDEYRNPLTGSRSLLSKWGGEGIYMWSQDNAPLLGVGSPSIVVVDLTLTNSAQIKYSNMPHYLSQASGGPSDPCNPDHWHVGELILYGDVTASSVVDVWQPGSPGYDQFPHLPQV